MTENSKQLIEELKEVMMNLHRSAGHLDETIRSIEAENKETEDRERMLYFIYAQIRYRRNIVECLYKDLDKKETELWSKLIDEYKKES